MSLPKTNKSAGSASRSKKLFTSSAACVLSTAAFLAAAPTAHAQLAPVVRIDACSDFVNNPLTDDGGTLQVFLNNEDNPTCTVSSGDNLTLDDDQNNVVFNVATGVTLINTSTSASNVVIDIDNAEDDNRINIAQGATLSGANGVIYGEGDGLRVVNNGDLIGTGTQGEGVYYIDRDTDADVNSLVNGATGRIIAESNGPAVGYEGLFEFNAVLLNRGLIQSNGTMSDDNDGVNIAHGAGNVSGVARTCREGDVVNCQINITIRNSGTIESVFADDTTSFVNSSAGINIEDDALFTGLILNQGTGLITGTGNGIRIDDIEDQGQTADHTGSVVNQGTITGTGANGRGIDLEGAGITISNVAGGLIQGVRAGIEVGNGGRGTDNVIFNRGTIAGDTYAIDSNTAVGAVTIINSAGGILNGDIRGSLANQDLLAISGGTTNLTDDVLQNFLVRVNNGGALNFVGNRTIEGDIASAGTLTFDLGNTQSVTGDVTLLATSTVALTDTGAIANLGDQFTLIDVGGTLRNNAALDTTDSSLLLDFEFVENQDLRVRAVASGGGTAKGLVSKVQFTDAATESFGENVLGAFAEGGLNGTAAFSNLVALETGDSVGAVLESLAPDFSGNLAQNIFSSVQNGTAQIDQRINDLNCNHFYDGSETTSLGSSSGEACQSFAETGAWIQVSTPYSTEGNLSLGSPSYFNDGSDNDSVTMTYGYDHAVDNGTVVGFTGRYTKTEINDDVQNVSSTDLDVLQLSAYAGHRIGNLNLVTKASYSSGVAETRRQSYEVIKSDVSLHGLNVQSVASYDVDLGKGIYLKPEAGFLYDNVTTNAFTEAGGLNLDVDGTSSNVLDARMGLTLGARRAVSDTLRADVYVTAAVVDDLYGKRDEIGYSFGGQSGSFASRSLDNFAVQGLMGVNLLSTENFSFGASVNSEFSDTESAVGSSLQTKLRW